MLMEYRDDYYDVDARIEQLFINLQKLSERYEVNRLYTDCLTVSKINTIHKSLALYRHTGFLDMSRFPKDDLHIQTEKDLAWLKAMMFAHNTTEIHRDTTYDSEFTIKRE